MLPYPIYVTSLSRKFVKPFTSILEFYVTCDSHSSCLHVYRVASLLAANHNVDKGRETRTLIRSTLIPFEIGSFMIFLEVVRIIVNRRRTGRDVDSTDSKRQGTCPQETAASRQAKATKAVALSNTHLLGTFSQTTHFPLLYKSSYS